MNLAEAKEVLELLGALVTPFAGIVLALYGWKKTGHIDLLKTLEHARDVVHIVKSGGSVDDAVKEVEHLRGKRLSTKLKRKLKARLDAITSEK